MKNYDIATRTIHAGQEPDPSTGAIIKVITMTQSHDDFITLGVVGNSVGLVEREHVVSLFHVIRTFSVLNPLSGNRVTGTWTPPVQSDEIACPAANQTTDDTAVFAGKDASTYRVFTSNIGQNTFGPSRSLAPALSAMSFPIAGGVAQNTKTGDALAVFADVANLGGPPSIVSVHLSDGSLRTIPGVTTFFAEGLAVDESTNTAISGSLNNDFGVYDLGSGAGIDVAPGGGPTSVLAAAPCARGASSWPSVTHTLPSLPSRRSAVRTISGRRPTTTRCRAS